MFFARVVLLEYATVLFTKSKKEVGFEVAADGIHVCEINHLLVWFVVIVAVEIRFGSHRSTHHLEHHFDAANVGHLLGLQLCGISGAGFV